MQGMQQQPRASRAPAAELGDSDAAAAGAGQALRQ